MRSMPVPIVCLKLGLGWARWEGEAHLTTSNDEALADHVPSTGHSSLRHPHEVPAGMCIAPESVQASKP